MPELTYAFAGSVRSWAHTWARHIADYGPGRVVDNVAERKSVFDHSYRLLVVDADSSLVDPGVVAELHARGTAVLAVWDPGDPRTKQLGLRLGSDALVEADATPEEFVRLALEVAGDWEGRQRAPATRRLPSLREPEQPPVPSGAGPSVPAGGSRVVVGGPATDEAIEVAIELARALAAQGRRVVVVDADEVHPGLAQRLGLALLPNLHIAVEAVRDPRHRLADALLGVADGGFWALPGLADPAQWGELGPGEVAEVVAHLATGCDAVVARTGPLAEDLARHGVDRFGVSRRLLADADIVVGVEAATPTGVSRLLAWLADVRAATPATPAHLVLARSPKERVRRADLEQRLAAAAVPQSVTLLPADPRVDAAAWDGAFVAPGPYTSAVAELASVLVPAAAPPRARWGRRGRA